MWVLPGAQPPFFQVRSEPGDVPRRPRVSQLSAVPWASSPASISALRLLLLPGLWVSSPLPSAHVHTITTVEKPLQGFLNKVYALSDFVKPRCLLSCCFSLRNFPFSAFLFLTCRACLTVAFSSLLPLPLWTLAAEWPLLSHVKQLQSSETFKLPLKLVPFLLCFLLACIFMVSGCLWSFFLPSHSISLDK